MLILFILYRNKSNISTDYLIKVLPQNLRVKIKNLLEISEFRNIIFEYNDKKYLFDYKTIKEVFKDDEINSEAPNTSLIKDDFFNYAKKIYELDESAKLFVEILFQNNLRRIMQFLNGEHKKNSFNITNETNLVFMKEKYTN